MFVSFLYPFPIRDIEAPFLWIFYKQLAHFKPDDIIYIASERYFAEPSSLGERWEFNTGAQKSLRYCVPSAAEIANIQKRIIDDTVFNDLDSFPTSNAAWKHLITEAYLPLEQAIESHLVEILAINEIDAILTWCNCRSLSIVAGRLGIPVIHNEQGPTREPFYTQTAYFDFSGVNGNTQAESRFLAFEREVEAQPIETLSKKELLYLLTKEQHLPELSSTAATAGFEVGLALQIEDDSNVIAYGKGYNNFELINAARKMFPKESILIRKHPRGHLEYKANLGVIDDSADVFEFLKKCRRVATVNSSVGLEALLFDKPTYILGDSPFAFLAANRLDTASGSRCNDQLLALNFAVFGYLIPYDLLFNADYYRWRLGAPSESEIYRYHLDYYRNSELPKPGTIAELSGREVFIYSLEKKLQRLAQEKQALTRQLTENQQESHQTNAKIQEEFQKTLSEKDAELARLDERLKRLSDQLTGGNESVTELEKSLQQGSCELVSRDDRIKRISEELDRWRMRQEELLASLEEKTAAIGERDQRIQMLEAELALESQRLEEHLHHSEEQSVETQRRLLKKRQAIQEQEVSLQAEADRTKALDAELGRLKDEITLLRENGEIEKQSYEERLREKEQRIADLLSSLSWRITSPLRGAYDVVKGGR